MKHAFRMAAMRLAATRLAAMRLTATLLVVIVLLPLYLLCIQSLVPPFDALSISAGMSPVQLFPNPFSLEQWQQLFSHSSYWIAFGRSLGWTIAACLVQVLVSFFAGYVLAKQRSRWCIVLVGAYMLMMLMPPQMTLLPIYRIAYANHLLNHPLLLYAPIAFAPFGTILMRQILLRWPDELTDCLRLEGGSTVQLMRYGLIPYCLPSLAVLFALTFAEGWNLVEQPLLLVSDSLKQPLSALLKELSASNPQIIFAASLMALVPVIAVLLALRGAMRR